MDASPSRFLLRARDLADRRFAEPIGVADMARAAGLSQAHFSREFRRVFGDSPGAYLLTRRLERAAFLLRVTDYSILDVCHAVGLSSPGSFTTSFRRHFGSPPAEYRRRHPPAAAQAQLPSCVVQAYGRPRLRTFREDAAPPPVVASPHITGNDEGDER
ncbi:MAG: AraC family transcriptional regulator [Thermoleophilia bacterium]